jgi:two-component system chemotaxis response regulator CheY
MKEMIMRCLIAEDEFVSRHMLKEMLPESFNVDIAVNGEEAVESFRMAHLAQRPYKLIFMDVEMPIVGGIEALWHIRELEREMGIHALNRVKVIMTTAHDDLDTVLDSLDKGEASSYIVKPVDMQTLMPELTRLGFVTEHPPNH